MAGVRTPSGRFGSVGELLLQHPGRMLRDERESSRGLMSPEDAAGGADSAGRAGPWGLLTCCPTSRLLGGALAASVVKPGDREHKLESLLGSILSPDYTLWVFL